MGKEDINRHDENDIKYWNEKLVEISLHDEFTGYEIMDIFVSYINKVSIPRNFTGNFYIHDVDLPEDDTERFIAHFKNGELNNPAGDSAILFQTRDGDIIRVYFEDGYIHRVDGPALTADFDDCNVEQWFIDGIRHRDYNRNNEPQPAFIIYYKDGRNDVKKYYMKYDKLQTIIDEYYDYTKDYLLTHKKYFSDVHLHINTDAEFLEELPKHNAHIYCFKDHEHIVIYFIGQPPEYKTFGLIFRLLDKLPIAVYNNSIKYKFKTKDIDGLYDEFNQYLYSSPEKGYLWNKLIENDGETTDEIDREIARLYAANPRSVIKIIEAFNLNGYKKYLLEKCQNLFFSDSETEIFIAVDSNKKYWCYNKNEWETIKNKYNPYNLSGVNREFNEKFVIRKTVKLSKEAYQSLKFWTELTFTMGKIYYNVNERIANEFAKTIYKNMKPVTLFRGMTFQTYDDYAKFISKYKCGDSGSETCLIKFDTFSSWTYDENIAYDFATKFKHGIVISGVFERDEILVDVTKVNDSLQDEQLRYGEEEVVILPCEKNFTIVNLDPHTRIFEYEEADEDEVVEDDSVSESDIWPDMY